MKPVRNRGDEEVVEPALGSPKRDWSTGLIRIVSVLVTFMAGAVLGLSVSAHFNRYFNSRTELFFPTTLYPTNCEKDCLSIDNFVKPKQLMHSLTNEELFWRASMVPKKEDYPFKRVQKVAFIFLTRGALPLVPLWDRFFQGHEGFFSVYVHSPPGYNLNVSKTSAFYGRQIPSERRRLNGDQYHWWMQKSDFWPMLY